MSSPPTGRVSIRTLGCRLNQFESDGILSQFRAAGFAVVPPEEPADVAIVNTCTVTDKADSRNRNAVRNAVRDNPTARVVVTGCYAQTDPEDLLSINGVSLVVGNDRKSRLFEHVADLIAGQSQGPGVQPEIQRDGRGLPVLESPFAFGDAIPSGHTRAYLKVQDGCDRKCSYCKIPQARGAGRSRALADCLGEAQRLEEAGVREIVLTGVNLGWYRDGNVGFTDLIEHLLHSLRHARLRISSLEPPDVDARLGQLSLHPRFCNFLHVPLQSGSRRILRRMRRTYHPESFAKRIETVRALNPRIHFGTDAIVGFPGETPDDFDATVELLQRLEFGNIHAFRFSARGGTPAAEMPGRLPRTVLRERIEQLHALSVTGIARIARESVGGQETVVVEHPPKDGAGARGLTGNYLRAELPADFAVERGDLLAVTLSGIQADGVLNAIPLTA